jgi:hypothetical protein
METYLTPEGLSSIIFFLMSGYFAIKTYSLIYSKPERDFSRVLVESAIFSALIVAFYDPAFRYLSSSSGVVRTGFTYIFGLFACAIILGFVTAKVRGSKIGRKIAAKLMLPEVDEDFLKYQFSSLRDNEPVTITLKNEKIFSGTPQSGSPFRNGGQRHYAFNDIAWYDEKSHQWDERPGSVLVDLCEVQFIETTSPVSQIIESKRKKK